MFARKVLSFAIVVALLCVAIVPASYAQEAENSTPELTKFEEAMQNFCMADTSNWHKGLADIVGGLCSLFEKHLVERAAEQAACSVVKTEPETPEGCPSYADIEELGYIEYILEEDGVASGVHITFNMNGFDQDDWFYGAAVDGVHLDSKLVRQVPGFRQASLWLVKPCRPIVVPVAELPTPEPEEVLACPTAEDIQSLGQVEDWLMDGGQVAGAHIVFENGFSIADWAFGPAVDAIDMNTVRVTEVPAGRQASLWIRPECRPIVSVTTP